MPAPSWMTSRHIRGFAAIAAGMAIILASAVSASGAEGADAPTPAPTSADGETEATAAAEGAPRFRCDEIEYDFGEVWATEKVNHTFVIHNDGGAPLTIDAKPTCGCTLAEFDKEIPPGGEGKIRTVLTTGNYTTVMKKAIVVKTNDPTHKAVNLVLKGKVKQLITTTPNLGAFFGQYTPEMNLSRTFKLTNNSDQPMKIEVQEPGVPSCFKVTTREIEPGKVVELTVTAEPPFNEGVNSVQFRIDTGVEGMPPMRLPCSLVKPPALQVVPPMVRLPASPLSKTYRQPIVLRNNTSEAVKLLSAECSDPRVKIEHNENSPGKVYTLTVEVPEGFAPAENRAPIITITTDYEDKKEITVPMVSIHRRPQVTRARAQTAESLIGEPAPDMVLPTPEGQQIRLGKGNNRVTLINFWSSWCTPSRTQIERLDRLYQTYRRKGVEFINVNVEQLRPAEELQQIIRELDSKIPVGMDTRREAAEAYGVTQFPVVFLVGKDGTVESVRRGIGRTPEEFDSMFDLLAEQLDLLIQDRTRKHFVPRPTFIGPTCALETIAVPPHAASGGPMIYVESLRNDAGMFKPKSEGNYKLYLRNAGGKPLEIASITGNRGLEVDPDHPKTLGPGETGAIECTFETPSRPQQFLYQVAIRSNDPVRPVVNVALVGESRPWIELQPITGIDFSDRVRTFSVPRIATLLYNGEGTVEYKEPISSSPKFEAEIRATRQPTVSILTVKAKPPFEQGETTATITVETSHPEQPKVEVPVRLFMPQRIAAKPAQIVAAPGQTGQQVAVQIVNSGDKPLKIVEVQKSNPEIQTQLFPQPDGLSYKLEVTLPASFTASGEGETVTVKTDDAEFPEIVIPIQASVPRAGHQPPPPQPRSHG